MIVYDDDGDDDGDDADGDHDDGGDGGIDVCCRWSMCCFCTRVAGQDQDVDWCCCCVASLCLL